MILLLWNKDKEMERQESILPVDIWLGSMTDNERMMTGVTALALNFQENGHRILKYGII